jgi:lysophospholipase L1-like esterase
MLKRTILFPLALLLFSPLCAQTPSANSPATGQKVAFMGDSITNFGWQKPAGYVKLVEMALEQQGTKIEVIPAGVSGNTSKDMLARVDRDVLSKKPDWMTLSCGVNDVWHGASGVALDPYKENINTILDKAQAAGIKVTILTATMISEDPAADNNKKLADYNTFLRDQAKMRKLPLADLNQEMQDELATMRKDNPPKGNLLTVDGVHMNFLGDEMMATGILKAWGFTDAQIAQAHEKWLDIPNGVPLTGKMALSPRDYLALSALAASQGKTVDDLLTDSLIKVVTGLLKK